MKRIFIYVFFIIAITKAGAENIFDFSWNFGNIGTGINYSDENDDNIEFNVSLVNFIFVQKDTNIGFEINPIKYWHLYKFQNRIETVYDGERFSFINVNTYWDLLWNKNFILGPFVSVNYLFINTLNGINMDECVFSGGLRFSLLYKEYIMSFNNYSNQIFSAEIGYRNLFGTNKFYFSICCDVILGMMGIGDAARINNR